MAKQKISNRPNVLFIICDDLNNAITGMGRTPSAPCPNLHSLMAQGVRFANAHSNCPICLPARNMLLSGLYAHQTRHFTLWDQWRSTTHIYTTSERRDFGNQPLLDNAVMMPKYFKDNDYNVYGAGKVHHDGKVDEAWWTEYAYGPDYGPFLWDSGNNCQAIYPPHRELYEGEPLENYIKRYEGIDRFFLKGDQVCHNMELAFGSMPEVFGETKLDIRNYDRTAYRYISDDDRDPLPDEKITNWAVDVINREHSEPFFLAVGFMKPHTPLNVPQKYFDMFPYDKIELPPHLENDIDDCARALVEHRPYGFLTYGMITKGGEAMWRKWLQSYLACVAFVDDQVGIVLDTLRKSPYAENTIIVFTSDNGYHMGEKEYIFKDSLWEEGGQIPLIMSGPGVVSKDGVCLKPVSLIDIYPTLCDMCGLPGNPHESTHKHPLAGHSLRPFLENPSEGKWDGPNGALISVRGDTGVHHSIRSERFRYTLCSNGEEELYDHESDPHEWNNCASDPGYKEIKQTLRERLIALVFGK